MWIIGFKIDPRTGRIIMMGAIDNLVKGAAGQAGTEYESDVRIRRERRFGFSPNVPLGDVVKSGFNYVPNPDSGCPKAVVRVSPNEDERIIQL